MRSDMPVGTTGPKPPFSVLAMALQMVFEEAMREVLDERALASTPLAKVDTLSVTEAARALSMSRHDAFELIKQTGSLGPLPVFKVGNALRISKSGLDALLEGKGPGLRLMGKE